MKWLTLSFLVLITACSSFSRSTLKQTRLVKPGQSRESVKEILGSPSQVRKISSEQEVWMYEIYSDNGERTYPYAATFANGVLTSFDVDSSRAKVDEELCRQRQKSDQGLLSYANGAPYLKTGPCSGITSGKKNEINQEAFKAIQKDP